MKKNIYLIAIMFALVFSSCEKQEGLGGTAKISGMLTIEQYNDDYSLMISSLPAKGEDIYIQYGDSKSVSDDVETGYDGYFEFDYLYEGDYTIFYYSKDSTEYNGEKKEIILEVSLSKDESKDLGDLIIFETLDFDDGKATISGNVYEVYFTYTSVWPNMIPEDTLIATDLPVYLRSDGHEQYDERIRTQEDGSFYFKNLIPGDYTVYVFSEDIKGTKQQVAIEKTITVSANEDVTFDIGDMFIYNL